MYHALFRSLDGNNIYFDRHVIASTSYNNIMKYLISSSMFVMLCILLCALRLGSVYGNYNQFCFNNSEKDFNFTPYKIGSYSNIIFPRSRTIIDSTEALTYNDGYCSKLYVYNHGTCDHHLDSPDDSDTLTQSDIVRNQYMTLPYPAVSHQQLEHEKIYYDSMYKTGERPFTTIQSFSFEALNHFLFKGRNNFRFVFTLNFSAIISFTNFLKKPTKNILVRDIRFLKLY